MKAIMVFQFNGYPERVAAKVVRENITDDDYWEEDLLGRLNEEGVAATKAEVGTPYGPAGGDFVCLYVPIKVEFDGDEEQAAAALNKWLATYIDDAPTFYADSCWLEEIVK